VPHSAFYEAVKNPSRADMRYLPRVEEHHEPIRADILAAGMQSLIQTHAWSRCLARAPITRVATEARALTGT